MNCPRCRTEYPEGERCPNCTGPLGLWFQIPAALLALASLGVGTCSVVIAGPTASGDSAYVFLSYVFAGLALVFALGFGALFAWSRWWR